MQTPRDRYYPEHQNHPRSLPSPVLRDRQAPSAQSGRLPGRRRGLGGAQLPQGAAWGTAPSPPLPCPHSGSGLAQGAVSPPSPHSLASSSSALPPPAAGGASQAHWPSSVSPRMDSRSTSSMLLPSEDSSLSKPNLRISLNWDGENKMVRSVPSTHRVPGPCGVAPGHRAQPCPGGRPPSLPTTGNRQRHFADGRWLS